MNKYEIDFSQPSPALAALVNDIKRLHANKKIDFDEQGRMVIKHDVNVTLGGVFHSAIDRHELVMKAIEAGDPEQERWARVQAAKVKGYYIREQESTDHNLIPDAGLNHYLDVVLGAGTQVTTWYFGIFKSNWTPVAGALSNWAGAGSGPLATELTQAEFDETGRRAAVFGAASSKVKATSTPTVFTLATGTSGISLYGATLNSIATVAYNATDKVLIAATRFSTTKTGLGATDKANVDYNITGSST